MHDPERVIVALDSSDADTLLNWVMLLKETRCAFKLGLEAFVAFGPDLVRRVTGSGSRLFLDLKFHDIPNTVAQAAVSASGLGIWMLNLHASAGPAVITETRKRLEAAGRRPLLIGVTVLTHLTPEELAAVGIAHSPKEWAVQLARSGKAAGLDGVVCSAHEAASIKEACGGDFVTVVPGIRLPEGETHDQKRIATPSFAFANGADYIVVGRPVTQAKDPREAFAKLLNA
jgi:orotidine-5'-phosphate decarboxylase